MEKVEKRSLSYYKLLADKIMTSCIAGPIKMAEFKSLVKSCDTECGFSSSSATPYNVKVRITSILGEDMVKKGENSDIQIYLNISLKDAVNNKLEAAFETKANSESGEIKLSKTLTSDDKRFHEYILNRAREYEGIKYGKPSKESIADIKKLLGRRPSRGALTYAYSILRYAQDCTGGAVRVAKLKEIIGWDSFSASSFGDICKTLKRYMIDIHYRVSRGRSEKTISFIQIGKGLTEISNLYKDLTGSEIVSLYKSTGKRVQEDSPKVVIQRAEEGKEINTNLPEEERFIARLIVGWCSLDHCEVELDSVLKVLRENTYFRINESTRSLRDIIKRFSDVLIAKDRTVQISTGTALSLVLEKYGPSSSELLVAAVSDRTKRELGNFDNAQELYKMDKVSIYKITCQNTFQDMIKMVDLSSVFTEEEKFLPTCSIVNQIESWKTIEKSRRFQELTSSAKADILLWKIEKILYPNT